MMLVVLMVLDSHHQHEQRPNGQSIRNSKRIDSSCSSNSVAAVRRLLFVLPSLVPVLVLLLLVLVQVLLLVLVELLSAVLLVVLVVLVVLVLVSVMVVVTCCVGGARSGGGDGSGVLMVSVTLLKKSVSTVDVGI